MQTESLTNVFPATSQDVSRLKQAATDAVSDLGSTAYVHASRVGGRLRALASDVQDEGSEQLARVRGRVGELASAVSDFATERPLVCLGAALAVGLLMGLTLRRRAQR